MRFEMLEVVLRVAMLIQKDLNHNDVSETLEVRERERERDRHAFQGRTLGLGCRLGWKVGLGLGTPYLVHACACSHPVPTSPSSASVRCERKSLSPKR
jgi:hypothetical protein